MLQAATCAQVMVRCQCRLESELDVVTVMVEEPGAVTEVGLKLSRGAGRQEPFKLKETPPVKPLMLPIFAV